MENKKSNEIVVIVIIVAITLFFIGVNNANKNDISKLEDKNEQLLEENNKLLDEYTELSLQLDNYYSAINMANDDIDLANTAIEEAKSFSGESCVEMKQALDDLFKIDVIDMGKNDLKIPPNFR